MWHIWFGTRFHKRLLAHYVLDQMVKRIRSTEQNGRQSLKLKYH